VDHERNLEAEMNVPRDDSALPERREPTHTLTISIPLDLEANPAAESWDVQSAMQQALSVLLPILSLGTLGLRCGDFDVWMKEAGE
jgi:hypothetical protein